MADRDFRYINSPTKKFDSNRTIGTNTAFNKIRVGKKTLENDVTLTQEFFNARKTGKKYTKKDVERAIDKKDLPALRKISEYYFNKSGIYERLCTYLARFFRYDYFVTPIVKDESIKPEKIIQGWYRGCELLENSRLKKHFGRIALKVIKDGAYYGYELIQKNAVFLQDLPVEYCRSRYSYNGMPAVEMNMKYFDDTFRDNDYRLRVVKMFPKEIQQAYVAYKKGMLPKDMSDDDNGWVLLDPKKTVKFSMNNSDIPMLVSVVPHLMDLETAQEIDLKRMEQQIIKIVVQKFPLDKNFELVFDMDEMNALHNGAVQMLGDAMGVDVLSTPADVSVEDMADNGNVSTVDQLEKVERTVYNEAGISQMQFNSDSSVALEKSIVNDESNMLDLVYQFEEYMERLLAPLNKSPKRLYYHVDILPTTGYNYQELAKIYKEQTMLGYSKLLPQVALGQKQTTVIAAAIFENKTLKLDEVFIPPQMSTTMSSSGSDKQGNQTDTETNRQEDVEVKRESGEQGGRPELADDEKSSKTVQNIESQ